MKETCRYCGLSIADSERVITHSYWQGLPFPCHKACKDQGVKDEAYQCQVEDADCNDCKHFKRVWQANLQREWSLNNRREWVVLTFQPEVWHGLCLKFNRPTEAYPKKWTGRVCFEHRSHLEKVQVWVVCLYSAYSTACFWG